MHTSLRYLYVSDAKKKKQQQHQYFVYFDSSASTWISDLKPTVTIEFLSYSY